VTEMGLECSFEFLTLLHPDLVKTTVEVQ
jgi:hypothetical protein